MPNIVETLVEAKAILNFQWDQRLFKISTIDNKGFGIGTKQTNNKRII